MAPTLGRNDCPDRKGIESFAAGTLVYVVGKVGKTAPIGRGLRRLDTAQRRNCVTRVGKTAPIGRGLRQSGSLGLWKDRPPGRKDCPDRKGIETPTRVRRQGVNAV